MPVVRSAVPGGAPADRGAVADLRSGRFSRGHPTELCSKILGPRPVKKFGPVSWSIFEALGLRVVVEVDPEAVERMRDRWVPRQVALRTDVGTDAAAAHC